MSSNITYTDSTKRLFKLQVSDSGDSSTTNYMFPLEDISQAHHFKIRIGKIPINYNHPAFGKFLPVKSANFNYVNFDNLTLSVGIYGGLPIMKRRSVGRLSLNIYDNHRDEIEREIKNWIAECFPLGKYVNYLECMASKMEYWSYQVTGKANQNNPYVYTVIPSDSYNVSRSYEENNAKIINFAVTVVGEGIESQEVQTVEGTNDYAVKNGSNGYAGGNGYIDIVNIPTNDELRYALEMPEHQGYHPA
jgi:hypothetical protein